MRSPRRAVPCAAVVLAGLVAAAPAHADFGPPQLLSVTPSEQADSARAPAISSEGRYVAFQGSFAGVTGVYRKDLATGAIELVAGGDAAAPSISADGSRISFTTTVALDPRDDLNQATDVYVRDMNAPPPPTPGGPCTVAAACPYELASARDGMTTGLAYTANGTDGSVAAGRVALSADGTRVAFVVVSRSDLVGGVAGDTPADQVVVRDLATDTTTLASVRYDPSTDTWKAGQPVPDGATTISGPSAGGLDDYGAALSADGTTVAWLGTNVAEQTRVAPDESTSLEPLWRRVADGPSSPVRRVTGGGDPFGPGCPLGAPMAASAACVGPLNTGNGVDGGNPSGGVLQVPQTFQGIPALSADGRGVAFLATAPPHGSEQPLNSNYSTQLYVADMHDGQSRVQALRPLTQSGGTSGLEETSNVVDYAISPDARHVAFTTARTVFPLASPAFVSPTRPAAVSLELYVADLDSDTLERVTQGYDGGPSFGIGASGQAPDPGAGASAPSFSGDDDTVAFASTANNLFFGDANRQAGSDGSDVFVIGRVVPPIVPVTNVVSPPPSHPTTMPAWRLGVTVTRLKDGSLRLYASVPGAGRVDASARATVLLSHRVRVRVKVRARAKPSRAHRPVHRGTTVSRWRTIVRSQLVERKVASATGPAIGTAGVVTIPLRLAGSYATLAGKPHGLTATLAVTFRPRGGHLLTQTIEATFLRRAAKTKTKAKAKAKAKQPAPTKSTTGGRRR